MFGMFLDQKSDPMREENFVSTGDPKETAK